MRNRLFCLPCFLGSVLVLCLVANSQSFFWGQQTYRWWPTNAPGMFLWLETVPFNTASNNANLGQVRIWTNLIGSGNNLTADQPLNPTNYVSGGGVNGTTPRVNFEEASGGDHRLLSGSICPPNATFIFVANCTDIATDPGGMFYNGTAMQLEFNTNKLQMSAGTTLAGAATITTNFYIITAVFKGAQSRIDTNGVLYVTGNAGTTALGGVYLANGQVVAASKCNICRLWGWTNNLSGADLRSAVMQSGRDFGITVP